ncbi:MAG: ATPase, T2SS/T4P/T4SS family, partial [Candidatus Omnitrophica bacterium]|nr:ATPase, T2SS/T4P/T4SS family [Candidatus Omnitrophota bacterium]
RSSFFAENRKIDLRISVLPTHFGEKIVTRLLDVNLSKTDLGRIGFSPEELETFREAITKPQGMVLVTGPTGSGKTSTLYAALNYIKSETRNIVTIEDPIEYLIDGINQIQVNPAIKFGFAEALRSILRQDPNVILVGEIRDAETAGIAFKASLTGHLVFSTLHTNNSVGTLTRLFDMGLEPFLVSSSIVLIIAQRLVRTICPHCKKEYQPEPKVIEKFKSYIEQAGIKVFYKGIGCQECVFSGFLGRAPIFEVLKVTEKLKILIAKSSSEDVILKEAKDSGFHLLAESGIRKVAEGATTLEEVVRVAEVMEEGAESEKVPAERTKPCVLVVDDEPDVLMSFQRRLATEGFDVVTAKDGQESIESAFNFRPDIILMDIKMPVLDGFEATKILRSRLETASIPLIMITAKADKESELKGFDSGADDYLSKPVDFEKLLARMRMLLRRRGQKSSV